MRSTLLFLDLENILLSTRLDLKREFDPKEVIALGGGWNRIKEAYAYADFSKVAEIIPRQLEACGFDCRHVPSRGPMTARKDLVDHVIGIDLTEIALVGRGIKEVILATGDVDLVPAASRVLKSGKELRILAVEPCLSSDLKYLVGPNRTTYLRGGRPLSWNRGSSGHTHRPAAQNPPLTLIEGGADKAVATGAAELNVRARNNNQGRASANGLSTGGNHESA
jgi:uncharacterized LabA/DUF88 family protein